MDDTAFDLIQASVTGPRGPVFQALDWRVAARGVTVLLGPAGSGKSALLRGLSGQPLPAGWRCGGSWSHRGRDLRRGGLEGEIAWLPQVPRAPAATVPGGGAERWRLALDTRLPTLLLDEPTRGEGGESVGRLAERLRAHAEGGCAVVVTHDVTFARRIADRVDLLCDGRIQASGAAPSFFEHPPGELAARFLAQGNCWPAGPRPPELPRHFHWIEPRHLAGMGRPGLLGPAEIDLEAIAAAGVTLLVTLTEEPLPAELLRPFGLQGRHFPIRDMGVPAIGPTASLCREIERAQAQGGVVAVHCHAGLGRTGTILASSLVWRGATAEAAIARVRAVGRSYIQNRAQEDFVRRFAQAVGPARA